MKAGPKYDTRKDFYREKFKTSEKWWLTVTAEELDQLDRCADDEARRIVLGVSK